MHRLLVTRILFFDEAFAIGDDVRVPHGLEYFDFVERLFFLVFVERAQIDDLYELGAFMR
jgi:hypothetical protein